MSDTINFSVLGVTISTADTDAALIARKAFSGGDANVTRLRATGTKWCFGTDGYMWACDYTATRTGSIPPPPPSPRPNRPDASAHGTRQPPPPNPGVPERREPRRRWFGR